MNVVNYIHAKILTLFKMRTLYELKVSGHLKEHGWILSSQLHKPVDGKGQPVPWMNYAVFAGIWM